MLNFEHESLESNESFVFKQLIRVIRVIRVPKIRNLRVEKYLLELCFVNMILTGRNHDT